MDSEWRKQVEKLRQISVPQTLAMLVHVLRSTSRYHEVPQLANIVASEEHHCLYRVTLAPFEFLVTFLSMGLFIVSLQRSKY